LQRLLLGREPGFAVLRADSGQGVVDASHALSDQPSPEPMPTRTVDGLLEAENGVVETRHRGHLQRGVGDSSVAPHDVA